MSRYTTDEEYAVGWRDTDYMVEGKWRVQFSRRLTPAEKDSIIWDALWDPQLGTYSMQRVIKAVTTRCPDITVLRSKEYDWQVPASQSYSQWDTETWTLRMWPRLSDEKYTEVAKRLDLECWDDEAGQWNLDAFRIMLEHDYDPTTTQYRYKS